MMNDDDKYYKKKIKKNLQTALVGKLTFMIVNFIFLRILIFQFFFYLRHIFKNSLFFRTNKGAKKLKGIII